MRSVAIASSGDAGGRYNVETPFSDTVGNHFAGGEWRADANHNQIIVVTNSRQKPRMHYLRCIMIMARKVTKCSRRSSPAIRCS